MIDGAAFNLNVCDLTIVIVSPVLCTSGTLRPLSGLAAFRCLAVSSIEVLVRSAVPSLTFRDEVFNFLGGECRVLPALVSVSAFPFRCRRSDTVPTVLSSALPMSGVSAGIFTVASCRLSGLGCATIFPSISGCQKKPLDGCCSGKTLLTCRVSTSCEGHGTP